MSDLRDAAELALEALESMSATLCGTTTPKEKEALVTLRRALGQESDHEKALSQFVYFDCVDFSRSPPYFRYDTDTDSTPDDRWHLFLIIQDDFKEFGYELTEVNIEHDKIIGNVTSLTEQRNNTNDRHYQS